MSTRSIESYLREAQQLIATGRLADARGRCSDAAQMAPNDPRIWVLAAHVELRLNKLADAVEFFRHAVECEPGNAFILVQYGQALFQLGKRNDALTIALRVMDLKPERPELQDALGSLLTHLEEPGRALPFFEQAVRSAPDNAHFRYNLAMVQRMAGLFEAAEANLDKVITARPDDGGAYHARSDLRVQTANRNHVNELEAALQRFQGKPQSLPITFALAKELEDLGEYARSIANLGAACRAHRASLQYNVADDVAVLEKLRATHTAKTIRDRRSQFDTQECIFIIGLPRSGTTLVSRIVGSHSDVYSAGELDSFPNAVIEAVRRLAGGTVNKLDLVERALQVDFNELGRAYLASTRPRTGHRPHFTDKLPLNYLYAGVIHSALPRARFIALRRHPMDSCYAMYKTLFASAYPFSYDLQDLALYYAAWHRLMRHWEEVIGEAWLSVSYEELVNDQEHVSQRIIKHCGLAWEEQCLNFHRQAAPVSTASAVHVRRPVYSNSVGKWRFYARELEPLARCLTANGIEVE